MKYKVYTNKIKLNVINEYLVTKKLKMIEIKTKYQLSTRSLIYNWVKKYQKNNNKLITSHVFKINHKKDKINIKDKNWKFEDSTNFSYLICIIAEIFVCYSMFLIGIMLIWNAFELLILFCMSPLEPV